MGYQYFYHHKPKLESHRTHWIKEVIKDTNESIYAGWAEDHKEYFPKLLFEMESVLLAC